MWHAWRTGHRPWHEETFWPGERATVYFCSCGEQFWPLTKEAPYPDLEPLDGFGLLLDQAVHRWG
jgi:hypothetical protein